MESVANKPPAKKRRKQFETNPANRIKPDVEFDIVYFDTETTGFWDSDQILQLAAKSGRGDFNLYCLPSVPIGEDAARVNKFERRGEKLFQNEREVATIERQLMLKQFLEFLTSHEKKILLVAHYAPFDMRFLWREITGADLEEKFKEAVAGYCDSIPFFKKHLPHLGSYKQTNVAKEIFGADFVYEEHDACADVAALVSCLEKFDFGQESAREFSVSTEFFCSK